MPAAPPDVDSPAPHEDEIQISNFGWWAIGGALGTALTVAVAFAILMGITSRPDYTNRIEVDEAAVSDQGGEGVAAITLAASEFAFDPAEFTARPEIEITIENVGLVIHNFVVEGIPESEFVVEADPGETGSATLEVEPGSYTFFCSIPGHREAGMAGEMVVVGE